MSKYVTQLTRNGKRGSGGLWRIIWGYMGHAHRRVGRCWGYWSTLGNFKSTTAVLHNLDQHDVAIWMHNKLSPAVFTFIVELKSGSGELWLWRPSSTNNKLRAQPLLCSMSLLFLTCSLLFCSLRLDFSGRRNRCLFWFFSNLRPRCIIPKLEQDIG